MVKFRHGKGSNQYKTRGNSRTKQESTRAESSNALWNNSSNPLTQMVTASTAGAGPSREDLLKEKRERRKAMWADRPWMLDSQEDWLYGGVSDYRVIRENKWTREQFDDLCEHTCQTFNTTAAAELAQNPWLPPDLLYKLHAARLASGEYLSERSDLPEDVALDLATHHNRRISRNLASGPSASSEAVARELASSDEAEARYALAGNPLTPAGVLGGLFEDPEGTVSTAAKENMSNRLKPATE